MFNFFSTPEENSLPPMGDTGTERHVPVARCKSEAVSVDWSLEPCPSQPPLLFHRLYPLPRICHFPNHPIPITATHKGVAGDEVAEPLVRHLVTNDVGTAGALVRARRGAAEQEPASQRSMAEQSTAGPCSVYVWWGWGSGNDAIIISYNRQNLGT